MRTSVTIPDEYYEKIKGTLQTNGYTTLSDYILDLIRKHQNGAEEQKQIPLAPPKIEIGYTSPPTYCQHGTPKNLCRYQQCRGT